MPKKYLRIEEIILELQDDQKILKNKIAKILNLEKEQIKDYKIVKKAIDSRNKNNILFVFSVDVELENLDLFQKNNPKAQEKIKKHKIREVEEYIYEIKNPTKKPKIRPIVVGSGPCGLFAGLLLAKAGLNRIILERGMDVDTRKNDVNNFFKTGKLNTKSNVQFGEGGAGTFSDGKLYTLVNDPRSKFIFEQLVKSGAPAEIIYDAKPHIGTDKLIETVRNLRKEIINLGGEVRFDSCLTDLEIENNTLKSIIINNSEKIEVNDLVLALGHSARDTYEMIYEKGLKIEQKPFAIGVRIEHKAEMINKCQFGDNYNDPRLPTASYKLVSHHTNSRSVYTFCMCPGGYVVAASSEEGRLCVNGMSEYLQDSFNSNSALLVSIMPSDFESDHPLAGIEFQRKWEKKAFEAGGGDYRAPAQLVGDFLSNKPSTKLGKVAPTYKPGITLTSLDSCLPDFVSQALRDAIPNLDRKIRGFANPDAILTALEARSSSVIRIVRNDDFQSNISGIYPAGEGAGYAGGITSSAIDGLKVTEAIIEKYL